MISGTDAPTQRAADDEAAAILNAFEGVELDAEAQDQIHRALTACAERRRALEQDPEGDRERLYVGAAETDGYLGQLESGAEGDWLDCHPEGWRRPDGEHRWENLGEGGEAERIDEVLAEMAARRDGEAPTPAKAAGRPPRRYKKRQPKPPFTPPMACPGPRSGEARKAEAVAAVGAERRALANAEADRRKRRKAGVRQA